SRELVTADFVPFVPLRPRTQEIARAITKSAGRAPRRKPAPQKMLDRQLSRAPGMVDTAPALPATAAAATAAAAATTAPAVAPTAAIATTAAARLAGARLVHCNRAARQLLAVHGADRRRSLIVCDFNEPEPLRAARLSRGNGRFRGAPLGE